MNPDIVCIAGDLFDGDMTALLNKEAIKDIFLSSVYMGVNKAVYVGFRFFF
jgi:hypothetical protein